MSDSEEKKSPALGLSLSQLIGGSLAAATAALLGSKLGTTGTIIGAALVSMVTAVGGALYTASLRRTREVVVRTREMLPTGQWRTVAMPEVQDQPDGTEADVADVDAEGPTDADPEHGSLWRRIAWKPVALVTLVVFLIAGALVTGAELATGHETTVQHVVEGGSKSTPTPSEPSKTPTTSATTSEPTTAPTTTTPSPSVTPATPTPTTSSTASASPSGGATE